MKENLEKKILIVEEDQKRIDNLVKSFGSQVEVVYTNRMLVERGLAPKIYDNNNEQITVTPATTEDAIAQVLKQKEYAVIFMDGHLGLRIGGEYFDGGVISQRLRDGVYGDINKNTPMFNTSSHYDNPHAKGWMSLAFELDEQRENKIQEYLK